MFFGTSVYEYTGAYGRRTYRKFISGVESSGLHFTLHCGMEDFNVRITMNADGNPTRIRGGI